MVVRRNRFQQRERARRVAALYRKLRGDEGPLNPLRQRRGRKPKRQFVRQLRGVVTCPAQRQRATAALEGYVVPAQGQRGRRFAARVRALSDRRVHLALAGGPLRGDFY